MKCKHYWKAVGGTRRWFTPAGVAGGNYDEVEMCIYCHKFRTIHAEWETCSCGTTGAWVGTVVEKPKVV